MELNSETRWTRRYMSKDRNIGRSESKFKDGTASITLPELEAEWGKWDEEERIDFCQSVIWADKKLLPEIMSFIMNHGSFPEWSSCAMSIVANVPKDEAIPFIVKACKDGPPGGSANLYQALARTKAAEAIPTLRGCLDRLWSNDNFLSADGWNNWVAFDATCCVKNLIELGVPPASLQDKFDALRNHPHQHLRSTANDYLGQYY